MDDMRMDDTRMDDMRLDGNVMAGVLGELFALEMTEALAQCAGCGATEPVGRATVYAEAPGMIVRCVHCESILIRVVQGGGRYWLDLRGVACLQIADPQIA